MFVVIFHVVLLGWTDTASMNSSNVSTFEKGKVNASISLNKPSPQAVTYVVEKCESEFDDMYSVVVKTSLGQVMVARLEPGQSYRFRVYSLNAEGVPGPRSDR